MVESDLDELVNTLLPFAQKMLAEHGKFLPFGACMKHDGEVVAVAGGDDDDGDDDERPPSRRLIETITAALQAKAAEGGIRAAALCCDVHVRAGEGAPAADAICVRLDHASRAGVDVYVPYTSRESGPPEYGSIRLCPGTMRVFDVGSRS